MNSFAFTLNKIAGAVLGTCMVGMGIGIVAQGIYEPVAPKKPGFALPEPKEEAAAGGGKTESGPSLPALLAKADPKKGETAAQVCGACHNFAEGAGAKVGPDLYGVVDREKGHEAGFDYSTALKKKGGKWTFADLNEFITKPSAYVPGTKMGYAGEDNPEKRANVIAYLRTLSKSPVPLPKVTEPAKTANAGGGKEAGGEKAGGGDQFAQLVAQSDPKKGESAAQICGACHNFKKGEGAKIGPDLYGVVDRAKGSEAGFDYSAGMKKKGGKWTYDDLNQFLTKPAAYVPGTKMGFAGEDSEKKRAAIVAYLRTLADTPAPLPGAGEKKPEQGAEKKSEEQKAGAKDEKKAAEGGAEKKPDQTAQNVEKGSTETKAESGAATGGGDIVKLVAMSDPKKGQSATVICQACHNFKKGEGNKIGPDLYGVVDRDKGSVQGFDYSEAMKKKGGKWTIADLNQFLTKPQEYVKGTKMGYPGEQSEKKRADIIAYLHTLSDNPTPLPGADKK